MRNFTRRLVVLSFMGLFLMMHNTYGSSQGDEYQRLTDKALTYANRGDVAQAVPIFNEAIKLIPERCEARHHKGQILELAGNIKEGLEELNIAEKRGCEEKGIEAFIYHSKSKILTKMGRLKEAIEYANKALQAFPLGAGGSVDAIRSEVYALKGTIFEKLKDYKQALTNLGLAAEISPNKWILHAKIGDQLMMLHFMEDALKAYDRALALNPSEIELYYKKRTIRDAIEKVRISHIKGAMIEVIKGALK